jgi:ankyrin repeat protein
VGVERWSRPFVNLPEYTPLHLAAVLDWRAIAELLLAAGADPLARYTTSMTQPRIVTEKGH